MLSSFVIGYHTARIDNLLQTLRFLVTDHPEVVSESQLVTVCQNTMKTQPQHILDEFHSLLEKFSQSDHFDMELKEMMLPLVTNHGVDSTKSDKVIILESDRLLPPGYFASVIEEIEPKITITCKNMKKLLKPATDDEIRNDTFEYRDENRTEANQIGVRNMWSGNTAIWKPDFYEAGKMDEAYVGYGWADSDMTNRMEEIGVKSVFRSEIELHLWHPAATYGQADQKKLFIKNGIYFCKKWDVFYPDWLSKDIANYNKVML